MTVTVNTSTPTARGARERVIRPERIIQTWVFRLLSDSNHGYLLLDSYSCGKAERGRIKPKPQHEYSRNGSTGDIILEDVPLPEGVQNEAKKQLLKQISVTKHI